MVLFEQRYTQGNKCLISMPNVIIHLILVESAHIGAGREDGEKWSDKDKAKLFADHLAVTFTPNDDEVDDEIARHLSNIPPNLPPIKSFTATELQQDIDLLNTRKASGIDKVTAKMLKELPKKGMTFPLFLFNALLRLNYWPKQLKDAEI
ncbi:hypothetical protein ILUMI_06299 [Ignelater luminosus]|uniref:Uncharacterized protein n=1 Tax=Ignelater luminosus TaxID=2038154 RepID=A0A8K0DBC8_IGNLU|nr:hypothetical protein ILUMI_06299 [Ignelater luminosus]